MKIVGISSSARSSSNAELLLDYVLTALRSDNEVIKCNLRDLKIDCIGCEKCYVDISAHQDDLPNVYEKMISSDLFIFSTPVQYGMPSALMKIVMDRSDAVWLTKSFKGKVGAAIVNGASENEGIEECGKNIQQYFKSQNMISIPFVAKINNTLQFPEYRLPQPLSEGIRESLDNLISECRNF